VIDRQGELRRVRLSSTGKITAVLPKAQAVEAIPVEMSVADRARSLQRMTARGTTTPNAGVMPAWAAALKDQPGEWVPIYRGFHPSREEDHVQVEVNRIFIVDPAIKSDFAHGRILKDAEYHSRDFNVARRFAAWGAAGGVGQIVVRYLLPKSLVDEIASSGHVILSRDALKERGIHDLRPFVDAVWNVPATNTRSVGTPDVHWAPYDGSHEIVSTPPEDIMRAWKRATEAG